MLTVDQLTSLTPSAPGSVSRVRGVQNSNKKNILTKVSFAFFFRRDVSSTILSYVLRHFLCGHYEVRGFGLDRSYTITRL